MGELQNIEQEAVKIYKFGRSHLILTGALVLALLFGIYSWDSKRADRADAKLEAAQALAKAADERAAKADADNKVFQQQSQAKEDSANQRVMQLQQEVDSLAKAMAQRNVDLANRQKTDATLPPTQLAGRWQDLIHVPNSIGITTDGKYSASQDGAVATVQALESVPVLTQNVKDLTQTVNFKDQQLGQKDTIITIEQARRGSDASACDSKLAAKDLDIKAKDAEIKDIKANQRKKSLKYMVLGGFILEAFRFYATGKP